MAVLRFACAFSLVIVAVSAMSQPVFDNNEVQKQPSNFRVQPNDKPVQDELVGSGKEIDKPGNGEGVAIQQQPTDQKPANKEKPSSNVRVPDQKIDNSADAVQPNIVKPKEKKKKGNKRQEKMLGPQHDGRHGASARINRIAHRVRHQLRPDKVGRFGSHGL